VTDPGSSKDEVSEAKPEITFLMFRKPLDDDKFALLRFADGVPIHWMKPNGMWEAFSQDDEKAVEEFLALIDSEDWPLWSEDWEVDDGNQS
jgi:hypothetical protein